MKLRNKLLLMGGVGLLLWRFGQQKCALVVLGNSEKSNAIERVGTAAFIANTYHPERIITSGKGKGIDGKSEAQWMADLLTKMGFPKIEIEPDSSNTASNVTKVAARLAGYKGKVYVVSNMDHVQSAAWCMRWVHGFDAYWIQAPDTIMPVYPEKLPLNCNRAGCC